MTSDNQTGSGSSKSFLSLKQFVVLSLVPIIFLMVGTGFYTYRMLHDIRQHTEDISRDTVSNVFRAQIGAVNLEGLRFSLAQLVDAYDYDQARSAYINAWKQLSESTVEEHEATRRAMNNLLYILREVWQGRQDFDNAWDTVRQIDGRVYADLLKASGAVDYAKADVLLTTQIQPLPHGVLQSIELYRPRIGEYEALFEKVCINPSNLSILPLCDRIGGNLRSLRKSLGSLNQIATNYQDKIAQLKDQSLDLRTEFSSAETNKLLAEIKMLNEIANPATLVLILLLSIFVVIFTIYVVAFVLMVKPMMTFSKGMNRFLRTMDIPDNPNCRILEINNGIEWIRKFCKLTKKNRAEKKSLQSKYSELVLESEIDPLTSVGNRKALRDFFKQNQTAGMNTALIMIDIDHFKDINDTRGHIFGDRILEVLAHRLRDYLVPGAKIYRYGGEEFCIIMTDATESKLKAQAEQLLIKVRHISREDASLHPEPLADQPLTISLGLSSITGGDDVKTFSTLLHEADTALYKAKYSGRNQFCIYLEDVEGNILQEMRHP